MQPCLDGPCMFAYTESANNHCDKIRLSTCSSVYREPQRTLGDWKELMTASIQSVSCERLIAVFRIRMIQASRSHFRHCL